jgi:hypothetical protein
MRILKLLVAAAIAFGTIGTLAVPTDAADAQRRHWRGDGHHARGDGHRHARGDGHRHWRGHNYRGRGWRNRRACRWVWRHGHRHRVCRYRRWR